jgi:ketosteroid isomerase-like protein
LSQQNVELVRALWDAFQRGDTDGIVERCTADVVIVQPPETPDVKSYVGHSGVIAAIEDFPRDWEDFRLDLTDIVEVSERVVLSVCRNRGRGRISGLEMDAEMFYVHQIREGRMAHMQIFLSRAQALAATGLEQ